MKSLKLLGTAALAIGALTLFLGVTTASATVLCETQVVKCEKAWKWKFKAELDWSLVPKTAAVLKDTSGNVLDSCTKVTKLETYDSDTTSEPPEDATSTVTKMVFESCLNLMTTLSMGKVQLVEPSGSGGATVKALGEFRFTINTTFFGSCVYAIKSGTKMGTVTGGIVAEGSTSPEVKSEGTVLEKISGTACAPTAVWDYALVLTAPAKTTFHVANEVG